MQDDTKALEALQTLIPLSDTELSTLANNAVIPTPPTQGTLIRQQRELDPIIVFKLAQIGCTVVEIGHVVGVSATTLRKSWSEIIEAGKSFHKVNIRKKQVEVALDGDTRMLVWLGKQILGQTEQQTINLNDVSQQTENTKVMAKLDKLLVEAEYTVIEPPEPPEPPVPTKPKRSTKISKNKK